MVMAHPRDRERWSDQRLLEGVAARDADAFRVLYRRRLGLVLSFLLREARDPEVAADLAAEVFAAVMIAAPRYEARHETAVPWLLGIARNVLGSSRRLEWRLFNLMHSFPGVHSRSNTAHRPTGRSPLHDSWRARRANAATLPSVA
jgi:DNA-directed RNA polymerase specialized sigma24 family protein